MNENKLALITGGSRGIGKAISCQLASDGFDIIINYQKSADQAVLLKEQIEKKFNKKVYLFQADLSEENEIFKLYEFVISNFKRLDVLINNAGVCFDKELSDRTLGQFEKTFKINTYAPFLLSKLLGRFIYDCKKGYIINISSNNSLNCFHPTTIDYDASKCALNSLTKNFAIEFSPRINVNAIAPGWIETEMNKELSPEFMELEKEKILKKKIGKPEDVANLVSFLVSGKADYINGELIVIDGGMS